VGWASLILIATSIPIPGALATASPAGADKLVHVTMYAVLAWLATRGATPSVPSVRAGIIVFTAVAAFGAVDEWHQRFIPGRMSDTADLVADIIGAGVGVLAFQSAHRRRESLS
jgi:VanZ family protein